MYSQFKDEMVMKLSYFYNRNLYDGNMAYFYWDALLGPDSI